MKTAETRALLCLQVAEKLIESALDGVRASADVHEMRMIALRAVARMQGALEHRLGAPSSLDVGDWIRAIDQSIARDLAESARSCRVGVRARESKRAGVSCRHSAKSSARRQGRIRS